MALPTQSGDSPALIRFRWGSLPEAMKHEGADGFIKFALGENVKQSNWGSDATTRFPQTRMGVEQVYEDHFTRAYEYGKALKADKPVRVDLELEALWEIINKKRFIFVSLLRTKRNYNVDAYRRKV